MSIYRIQLPEGPFYSDGTIEGIKVVGPDLKDTVVPGPDGRPLDFGKRHVLCYEFTLTGPDKTNKTSLTHHNDIDLPFDEGEALSTGWYELAVQVWVATMTGGTSTRQATDRRVKYTRVSPISSPTSCSFEVLAGDGQTVEEGERLQSGEPVANLRLTPRGNAPVELQRTAAANTNDMVLWAVIKRNRELFSQLAKYLDERIFLSGNSPFQGVDSYAILKSAVDTWMKFSMSTQWDVTRIRENLVSLFGTGPYSETQVQQIVSTYYNDELAGYLTGYLNHIYKLHPLPSPDQPQLDSLIRERLTEPALCELIWSYWVEEGMQVQTMQAIALRFQNKLAHAGRDPLAKFNTSPLRPLSNLLWGYIQAEQDRLSVRRRNYEYDHHYGISLHGKAVQDFQPADSRTPFMGAFHRLLHLLGVFYKQKDDTTIYADAFPVRNALREVHLILSEGAHNQFGDLPWEARAEMYIEQYILSRPEMREFLGGRSMVPYIEPWMENVDTMKKIQNWTDVSVQHFHTLARTGEMILLSVRHGDWNAPEVTANNADHWAVAHRPWVQEYTHAYTAVTGVDLTAATAGSSVDATIPSVHLRRRLEMQTGKTA